MTMKTTIEGIKATTFTGFYNSVWIDWDFNNEREQLDYEGCTPEQIEEIFETFDFKEFANELGKNYVNYCESELNSALGTDATLTFKEFWSPREYNFRTDEFYFTLETEEPEQFTQMLTEYLLCDPAHFQEQMDKDLKSRSGFISFYEDDRDLNEFDTVKLGLLLGYVLEHTASDDFEINAYEWVGAYPLSHMDVPKLVG